MFPGRKEEVGSGFLWKGYALEEGPSGGKVQKDSGAPGKQAVHPKYITAGIKSLDPINGSLHHWMVASTRSIRMAIRRRRKGGTPPGPPPPLQTKATMAPPPPPNRRPNSADFADLFSRFVGFLNFYYSIYREETKFTTWKILSGHF